MLVSVVVIVVARLIVVRLDGMLSATYVYCTVGVRLRCLVTVLVMMIDRFLLLCIDVMILFGLIGWFVGMAVNMKTFGRSCGLSLCNSCLRLWTGVTMNMLAGRLTRFLTCCYLSVVVLVVFCW